MLRVAAGRAGGPAWRYPCSSCCLLTTTAADAESLLSSSSSSSSDENITSANKGHKRIRSNNREINNRQHGQNQTQGRRRHKAKAGGGARRSAVQAGDALAATAAAERALPDKAALLLPRATERMEAFLRSRALLPPPPSAWLRPVDGDGLSCGDGDDANDEEAHDDDVLAQRIALHNDVVQLLLILRDSILGGHVSPAGVGTGSSFRIYWATSCCCWESRHLFIS